MINTQASWDILFVHADIATMARGRYNIIKDGAIGVAKGKIQWIGPFDKLQSDKLQPLTLPHCR